MTSLMKKQAIDWKKIYATPDFYIGHIENCKIVIRQGTQ